jgi:hypothetical protein
MPPKGVSGFMLRQWHALDSCQAWSKEKGKDSVMVQIGVRILCMHASETKDWCEVFMVRPFIGEDAPVSTVSVLVRWVNGTWVQDVKSDCLEII